MTTTRTITTNYTIIPDDAIGTVLQVNANAQAIVLTLPNTDSIADDTWTIDVTDATNTITLVDSTNTPTIDLGNDTAFQTTASLTAGTTNLRFDGTHFTFIP